METSIVFLIHLHEVVVDVDKTRIPTDLIFTYQVRQPALSANKSRHPLAKKGHSLQQTYLVNYVFNGSN